MRRVRVFGAHWLRRVGIPRILAEQPPDGHLHGEHEPPHRRRYLTIENSLRYRVMRKAASNGSGRTPPLRFIDA